MQIWAMTRRTFGLAQLMEGISIQKERVLYCQGNNWARFNARYTATIAKIDVNKPFLPCLYSGYSLFLIQRQNRNLRVCGQIARVVEGNERNCWKDQIHQVGLTITNSIGKPSGGGLGYDSEVYTLSESNILCLCVIIL